MTTLSPYLRASALSASARDALARGDAAAARALAMQARVFVQAIADPDERDRVVADLASLSLDAPVNAAR